MTTKEAKILELGELIFQELKDSFDETTRKIELDFVFDKDGVEDFDIYGQIVLPLELK